MNSKNNVNIAVAGNKREPRTVHATESTRLMGTGAATILQTSRETLKGVRNSAVFETRAISVGIDCPRPRETMSAARVQ